MATGIALIGSGIFAREQHLPAIKATPLLNLKAIYSRSLSSAQALAADASPDVDLYSEDQDGKKFEDLLKREDISSVIIALPIPVQPTYIKAALSAGKHVLAEKPIAKDIATATELIQWYQTNILKTSAGGTAPVSTTAATGTSMLAIAENFRFMDSFNLAAQRLSSFGRILGFRTRVQSLVAPGGKYFETYWRKVPEYQGGFLLDGGVHFVAATRLLLGEAAKPVRISAFTAQLQEHLPPVDTMDATVQLANGASGTLSVSFGTTFSGSEYTVAAEGGTVWVSRGKVVVSPKDGEQEVREFPDEGTGVKQEVKAWAESLISGVANEGQSAEEALRDLEVVEKGLRSGENGGAPFALEL